MLGYETEFDFYFSVYGGAHQPELCPTDCGQLVSGKPVHLIHFCHNPHQLSSWMHGGNGM
jgi:hypothetical protein